MSGLQLIEELSRQTGPMPSVIFVTAQFLYELQARHFGHVDIEQQYVYRPIAKERERLVRIDGKITLTNIRPSGQYLLKGRAGEWLVIDNEGSHHAGSTSRTEERNMDVAAGTTSRATA
jgi:hypothetical protein